MVLIGLNSFRFLSKFNYFLNLLMYAVVLSTMILQELRMYNPNYLERPYIVVLNKVDIPKVCVLNSLFSK